MRAALGTMVMAWFGTVLIAVIACAPGESDKPVLRDIYGADHVFDEFKDNQTQAIVFVILDDKCPVVQKQLPAVIKLYRKYNSFERDRAGHPADGKKYPGDKVRFIGVYVKPDQSAKSIADHALSSAIPFRVLRDTNLDFVKKFGVTRLSEVTVFDPKWKVIYQGPVDDQYAQGSSKPKASHRYLEEVLDSVLAKKEGPYQKIPAVGCLIDADAKREYPKTTYADVAPIFKQHCAGCHREGEVGPMPLTSYKEVADYAAMIEEVVREERMPPWPGSSPLPLRNTLTLSTEEQDTLLAWLRSKTPLGDVVKTDVVKTDGAKTQDVGASASTPGWRIGEPDFVFEMPQPYKVPATGVIDYVYMPIEINGGKGFDEDRWLEAIEVRPGAPQVVHHVQVHELHGKISAGQLDPVQQLLHYGLSAGNARLLGSYSPGNISENALIYSSYLGAGGGSVGMKLHRGVNLLLEMHYTPNGREALDKTAVAIRFAKQKPETVLDSWYPTRKRLDMVIPSNVENHSLQDRYHFGNQTGGKPILLYGIRPHLHSRGKSYRIELIQANSVTERDMHDFNQHDRVRGEVLLKLPVWDFNWQHFYWFEEPIVVRPDQALLATAYWDNTKHNPRNPDATADVMWGQQTDDEMFNSFFKYEILEPSDPRLQAVKGGK
jgi:mono/diheme cytochrome c family protein